MFAALGAFLSMAVSFCEAHPEITRALWSEVANVIGVHAAHPAPNSPDAVIALHAGIAAAAASAVTSVAAKVKGQAIPASVV